MTGHLTAHSSPLPTHIQTMLWVILLITITTTGLSPTVVGEAPYSISIPHAGFQAANFTQTRTSISPSGSLLLTPSPAELRWSSSARYGARMAVHGFETSITFRMSNVGAGMGADGLAFVVLSSPATTGTYGGGLGYADLDPAGTAGLPNSWAIEFDTKQDALLNDPPHDHISVHSAGVNPNSADEDSPARLCPLIQNILPMATVPPTNYTVRIRYVPPYGWLEDDPDATASLTVWTQGISNPVATCVLDRNHTLAGLLQLPEDGTADLMFTSATDGTADVHEILAWDYVSLAVPNGNTSTAQGQATTGGEVGAELPLTVSLYDQFGYRYTRDASAVSCSATLGSEAPAPCSPGPDGTLSAQVSSTVAGSTSLAVSVEGYPVVGSPFEITLSPGAADPATSSVSGVPASVTAGTPISFTVDIVDQYGNTVADPDLVIVAQVLPPGSAASFSYIYSTTVPGQYGCVLTMKRAGDATLALSANGVGFDNSKVFPLSVAPGPVDPDNTGFDGPGLSGSFAGVEAHASLALYDAFANRVMSGSEPVSASFVDGPDGPPSNSDSTDYPPVSVSPAPSGNYSIDYTVETTGVYKMGVVVGEEGGSSATFDFDIAVVSNNIPNASQSSALGPGLNTAHVAGVNSNFIVIPRDAYGNLVSNAHVDLRINIEPVETGEGASVAATYKWGVGQFDVRYDATIAADYAIFVTINGDQIMGSPFDVTIIPSVADPSGSRAAPTSSSALSSSVTGKTESFIVLVEDEYGNVVSSLSNNTVHAFITGPHDYPVTCTPTGGPAVVACSYSVAKTGTYELHVLVDGQNVEGSPFRLSVSWAHTVALVVGLLMGVVVLVLCGVGVVMWRRKRRRGGFVRF